MFVSGANDKFIKIAFVILFIEYVSLKYFLLSENILVQTHSEISKQCPAGTPPVAITYGVDVRRHVLRSYRSIGSVA